MPKFSASSTLWFLRIRFLNIFSLENSPFMSPQQPIKLSDLCKSHMTRRGLLNKHFCKKSNIPNETAEIANFHFSYSTLHGDVSVMSIVVYVEYSCIHMYIQKLKFQPAPQRSNSIRQTFERFFFRGNFIFVT